MKRFPRLVGRDLLISIYLIKCLVNNKVYVGQTASTITKRWRGHIHAARNGSKYLIHQAIRKYGPEWFEVSWLFTAFNTKSADWAEKHFIQTMYSTNHKFGYNVKPGGKSARGYRLTAEHCKKISIALIGRKIPKEQIERQRQSSIGKTLTEEHKRKISQSLTGRKQTADLVRKRILSRRRNHRHWHSESTKKAICQTLLGRRLTKKHRENIHKSLLGRNVLPESSAKTVATRRHRYKYWHTEFTKEKIRQTLLAKNERNFKPAA